MSDLVLIIFIIFGIPILAFVLIVIVAMVAGLIVAVKITKDFFKK